MMEESPTPAVTPNLSLVPSQGPITGDLKPQPDPVAAAAPAPTAVAQRAPDATPPGTRASGSAARLPTAMSLNFALSRALPLAGYYLTRVGPAGVAGISASAVAAVLGLMALLSGRSAIDALTTQIARAQQQHNDVQHTDQEIGKLVAALPTRDQMPVVIGTIFQQAQESGVALDSGHYTFTAARPGGTARYDLDFPVKADYPSVRQFINRTLTAVPAAGLEKLRIERKAVGDTQVSADVHFVVFVRSD